MTTASAAGRTAATPARPRARLRAVATPAAPAARRTARRVSAPRRRAGPRGAAAGAAPGARNETGAALDPRSGRGGRLRHRLPVVLALLLAAGLILAGGAPAAAQPPGAVITDIDAAPPTPQLDGLEWTFVRIRYSSWEEQLRAFRARYWSDPWAIDGPAAEQNLSRRLGRVTSIRVKDPVVLTLADERLWEYPWIYFVEPGNLRLKPDEVEILREFLLRGGTATFDDFHGPVEFATVQKELGRVFPEREIVKLPLDHPVFSAFYRVTEYPQIPGLGSFFNGVTWEKGGVEAGLHAILDDDGRAMVLLNFNTDMGDGWEWSNAEDYPGYIQYTAQAYRMMINEVVYALTH